MLLCVLSLSKISHSCARHHMLLRHELAVAVFPVMHPIPHHAFSVAAPHSIPRCARSSSLRVAPRSTSLCVVSLLLRVVPRPLRVPRCCRHRRSPPKGHGHCRHCGRRDARSQQGDVVMKVHVASACSKCFRWFRGML
jgi:hypothetical protein